MNIKIQILSLLVSFLYGCLLRVCNMLNNELKPNKLFLFYITNIIYIFIVVLIYIILLYYVNNGIFHLYFSFFIILGYILMYKCVKFLKIRINHFISRYK